MLRGSSDDQDRSFDHPSLHGVGVLSVCWMAFFVLLVVTGASVTREQRLARAVVTSNALEGWTGVHDNGTAKVAALHVR